MATFNLHVGGPKGYEFTRQADGVVLFGALVIKGTDADEVIETATTSATPWAVSVPQEHIALENSAESYADDAPCKVMALVPGMALSLLAGGNISAGDSVCPSTDGKVVASAAAAWENEIGIAPDAISSGSRGVVIITKIGAQ